jgi:predicted extracellular nuclease
VEPDETFTVTLSSVVGANPVAPTLTATGTILNDDISAVTLGFSPATIPDGTEGVAYSQVLTVTNGDTCSFSSTGALPAGVTLSFTGTNNQATLSGIPSFAGSSSFTISANCADGSTFQAYSATMAFACETGVKTSTPIHSVQGSGAASPLTGQAVEVEGIVVGAFQGTTQLHGFYLQEPDSTWDGDPLTSEGVFIFDNGVGAAVNVGDRVRVQGTVAEFTSTGTFLGVSQGSSLTEIGTVLKKSVCSTGNSFTRTTVTLPTANAGDLERYEGMAIQFAQQLTVTGNFSLGTQGWLDLAPSLIYVPTRTANQANWPVQTSLNARSVVALDDASTQTNTNLYPTLFPTGGLSASNTLRAGSLVNYDSLSQTNTPLIGIMDDRFGEYRVQPTAPVTFYAANPRPDIAPLLAGVGGRFRAVSANVLNFFTTLGSRGAATSTEFDHQKTKVIEALWAMNADVYGLSEVQNYNDGNTGGGSNTYTNVALQSIVDGLNCKASGMSPLCVNPPTIVFALIDTVPLGGSNGTDAIRSAIVYKPSILAPVGGPAEYYQNDTNRPTLAQTFKPATGAKPDSQTFTFVVNHFRSRASACNGGLDSTLQGNCNGLRLNMAQNVVTWLAGNPTADPASASRKILIVGDFNAYYGEDPIQYFANNGYPNLINAIVGIGGYSYNFGSQAGYLDHGIANNAMNALVRSIAEWHNNSDEPSSLQALGLSLKSAAAQVAYYGADPWAASDHDPFVIGFNTLVGDLNDDGVVNTADQLLLTGSVGKNASQVDRRMDYDGDGKITLNDYRIWATYYKAFIQ